MKMDLDKKADKPWKVLMGESQIPHIFQVNGRTFSCRQQFCFHQGAGTNTCHYFSAWDQWGSRNQY